MTCLIKMEETMEIDLSLGFSVIVNEDGTFELPNRLFTTTDLKRIAREINRELRKGLAESNVGVLHDEE